DFHVTGVQTCALPIYLAHAYVANLGADSVSVIDTATNAVVKTVPVGRNPISVAITPNGATAYVVNLGADSVSVIDTATNAVVKRSEERRVGKERASRW